MAESGASILRDGVLLLGFGLAFVLLFRRLGLGATLGWLVAGAVVGPHVLGLAGNANEMIGVAELGITLLLFIVGLELSPSRLWQLKNEIFGLGLAQVVLCGLALFGLVYVASHFSAGAALAIGLPLALSSTAQVLPMLQSAGRLRSPFGERAFAILLFQDLSLIPLLTIVASLSRNPADDGGPPGQTSSANLAPLCRLQHRIKTHGGWTYTMVEPGAFLWRSPYGYSWVRDRTGTTDLTPPPVTPPPRRTS